MICILRKISDEKHVKFANENEIFPICACGKVKVCMHENFLDHPFIEEAWERGERVERNSEEFITLEPAARKILNARKKLFYCIELHTQFFNLSLMNSGPKLNVLLGAKQKYFFILLVARKDGWVFFSVIKRILYFSCVCFVFREESHSHNAELPYVV